MPQRAIVSSRSPSTVLTMGAIVSGNTPGNGGRLPVWACMDRVKWRMADWPWVIEQRWQMGAIPSFTKTQPLTAGRKQSRAVRDSLHADGWIASEAGEEESHLDGDSSVGEAGRQDPPAVDRMASERINNHELVIAD